MKFIKICEYTHSYVQIVGEYVVEGIDGIIMIMMWKEIDLISHANTICIYTYERVHEVSHHMYEGKYSILTGWNEEEDLSL